MEKRPQSPTPAIEVVILAAGKGTRMKSQRPKVLHRLAGRTLLSHVADTAAALDPRQTIVITGHAAEQVQASLQTDAAAHPGLKFAHQEPQLGTGHAVQQAAPWLHDDALVLVLYGDVPLIQADTLRQLVQACNNTQLALLTIHLADPSGYGRIVRAHSGTTVHAIVEEKDASAAQRQITEVYSGIMAAPGALLKKWLSQLTNHNRQGEYYLTDVVQWAVTDGVPVVAHTICDAVQVTGVNDPVQLAALERAYQQRAALALLNQGVRLADPARLDVRGVLHCDSDVFIDVNCIFEGVVRLGPGVSIGAHCVIANADIAAGAVIRPFTHIEGGAPGSAQVVQIGADARIGPFARLRAGTKLDANVHIGNFVELKNSTLGNGAKANHLAYLGDATVGEQVNFGAGSITANYDGAHKHQTHIEANAHIGSNCVLIAPLTIGAGGTVGGGSTLTKSTAPGALTVARAQQVSVVNWKRPRK
jgi:bifunctional UDP-N-acetylglucosamine pyrophosphorylase/glucosamine-1-phosphate N-acetyltransferase